MILLGGSSTPSSCKYAVVPDKCLGSPQDLSLTHLTAAGPPIPTSVPTASSSSSSAPGKHDKSSSKQSQQRHHHSNKTAVAASSPSSVSSVSSGSSDPQSPGGQGDGKNPNAPQIYPWMKRVHLGQSKSSINSKITSTAHFSLTLLRGSIKDPPPPLSFLYLYKRIHYLSTGVI